MLSKLLVEGSNRRIHNIDRHVGVVGDGAGGVVGLVGGLVRSVGGLVGSVGSVGWSELARGCVWEAMSRRGLTQELAGFHAHLDNRAWGRAAWLRQPWR